MIEERDIIEQEEILQMIAKIILILKRIQENIDMKVT